MTHHRETPRKVTLIETGVANIASVRAAFARLNAELVAAADADEILSAEHVILPGVGAFGAGMSALSARGFDAALAERIRANRATLTICLGLQLLAKSSDESPGVAGLGIFDLHVSRFPGHVRVPQLGWNEVAAAPGARTWLETGHAYFANSFRLTEAPDGWDVALSDHGGAFVAAVHRDRVLACQFHPELSGPWGANLLARWLDGSLSC